MSILTGQYRKPLADHRARYASRVILASLAIVLFIMNSANAQKTNHTFYELRTYHCPEGKRPGLVERFRDHTLRLFEKHGIKNIAYFLPTDPSNNILVFVISYPSQALRDSLWNSFFTDPEWQEAARKSEAGGKLVSSVDQAFLQLAPDLTSEFTPERNVKTRVFELRTYTCHPGKVPDLTARFRDHTREIFQKHGMTNIVYWYTVEKDGAQSRLVYLLAHPSEAAGRAAFEAFRKDPEWVRVRTASEEAAPIVEKVESLYLTPLPFSPLQ